MAIRLQGFDPHTYPHPNTGSLIHFCLAASVVNHFVDGKTFTIGAVTEQYPLGTPETVPLLNNRMIGSARSLKILSNAGSTTAGGGFTVKGLNQFQEPIEEFLAFAAAGAATYTKNAFSVLSDLTITSLPDTVHSAGFDVGWGLEAGQRVGLPIKINQSGYTWATNNAELIDINSFASGQVGPTDVDPKTSTVLDNSPWTAGLHSCFFHLRPGRTTR
tara:strand:+ start:149 stop:799 length:651 start_codon:yes stop_codon:yes gene_type:complete